MRTTVALALALAALAAAPAATAKPGPQKSGVVSNAQVPSSQITGVGVLPLLSCELLTSRIPSVYSGNFLLDCDGETPHNEAMIAVDPADPDHAIAAFHTYALSFVGSTVVEHVVGSTSVTVDGGRSWSHVIPPITPYQFTGDPAVAFDSRGTVFFTNIADHEGPGGPFTSPSVVVQVSADGGFSWSNPLTVARGQGGQAGKGIGQDVFDDKPFVAADRFPASPSRDRVFVSWTSFQDSRNPPVSRSPIKLSWSDGGATWSPEAEISGSGPFCAAQLPGVTGTACQLDQDSYPTVAPTGRVYVSFENFNTPAENQLLVVRSDDGGRTFSAPVRLATVFDINYPINVDHRQTLTGCQLRVGSVANSAADPSDPTGNTVYVTWSDNRNGTAAATNADVFLARSTDGGTTWTTLPVDTSPNDQFFPAVAVGPDGRVDVGYMDRSWSSGQGECKYGFTLSRVTFDAQGNASITRTRVDTGLSHADAARWFSASTAGNTRFIGDYNGVSVASDGSTWSAWTDERALIPGAPAGRTHGQHAVGARTP